LRLAQPGPTTADAPHATLIRDLRTHPPARRDHYLDRQANRPRCPTPKRRGPHRRGCLRV
jgi:hypothetical protein